MARRQDRRTAARARAIKAQREADQRRARKEKQDRREREARDAAWRAAEPAE